MTWTQSAAKRGKMEEQLNNLFTVNSDKIDAYYGDSMKKLNSELEVLVHQIVDLIQKQKKAAKHHAQLLSVGDVREAQLSNRWSAIVSNYLWDTNRVE